MANPSSFPIPNIDTFITLRGQAKNPDDLAAIAQFEHQLLTTFERMPDPSSSWITDILFLAFAAHDDEDLLGRILNVYLSNISKTKILSFRTVEGLANLLGIASQFSLLDAAKISQIFEVLTQKSALFRTDLAPEQFRENAVLLEHMLVAMQVNNVELGEHRKKIKIVVRAMKQSFETKGDERSLWQVKLIEQALLRLKDKTQERNDWIKIGFCLGAAGLHLVEGVGIGVSAGSATYGIGSLAAVPALLSAVGDVGQASLLAIKKIKTELDKKDWYYRIRDLKALVAATAFSNNPQDFVALMAEVQTLEAVDQHLIYGLTDTLIHVCVSLPNKDFELIHRAVFDTLKGWFNCTQHPELRAHLVHAYTLIGSKINSQDFLEFVPRLIEKDWKQYSCLPIRSDDVEALVTLYVYCSTNAKAEDGSIYARYILGQQGIHERLEAQFASSPKSVSLCLARLSHYHDIDLSLINATQDTLSKQPDYAQYMSEAKGSIKKLKDMSSFTLTVWFGLNPSLQTHLTQLCQASGLTTIPLKKEESEDLGAYLFGSVGQLILTNVVRGGTQINEYPPELKTAKEFAEFLRAMQEPDDRPILDDASSSSSRLAIAKTVGFAYIGNYLVGGLQVGIPKQVAEISKELANRLLDEQSADNKPLISLAQTIPATGSPVHTLPPTSQSIRKWTQREDIFSINPHSFTYQGSSEEGFMLEIKYAKLNQLEKKNVQPILLTASDSGDYIPHSTKRRGDGVILSVGFYSEEAALNSMNEAWGIINNESASYSSSSSESTSGLGVAPGKV